MKIVRPRQPSDRIPFELIGQRRQALREAATGAQGRGGRNRLGGTVRHQERPFDRPDTGKIAVKVIDHYGDEVLKVFGVA